MLTGPLIRADTHRRNISPSYVDPDDDENLLTASVIREGFFDALRARQPRGEFVQMIEQSLVTPDDDPRFCRGLIKIALDRSEFDAQTNLDPRELRQILFVRAQERGPLALGDDQGLTAQHLYQELADERGVDVALIRDGLFGDLQENQRLQQVKIPSAKWLLDRYNVGLVQALLLRATKVTIVLTAPDPKRVKALFRSIRFRRLLHETKQTKAKITIQLDGPLSLFRLSTRYGMALANFFPSLLHCETDWSLTAEVLWGKRKGKKKLVVTREEDLVSHTTDSGVWRAAEQIHFEERFNHKDWTLTQNHEPLKVGRQRMEVPDYILQGADKKCCHLVWVGVWREEVLRRRVEAAIAAKHTQLIFVASSRNRGCKGDGEPWPEQVLFYKGVVSQKELAQRTSMLARRLRKVHVGS